jgi:hypothetical protein
MPALPPVAKTLKVVCSGLQSGINWANIFHFLYTGPAPSGTDCVALATSFHGDYASSWMPSLSSGCTLEHTEVTDLDTAVGAGGGYSATNPGGAFGSVIANQLAAIINWHAPTRYRGGHPKTFIPGLPNGSITDALHLTPAKIADLQTASNNWLFSTGTITHGAISVVGMTVVHYRRHNVALVPPQSELVSGGGPRLLVGSQRGRRA